MNEINKTHGEQGCVFIYFITKLSRMGSGTSYVGFHGGRATTVVSGALHMTFACSLTRARGVPASPTKGSNVPGSDSGLGALRRCRRR